MLTWATHLPRVRENMQDSKIYSQFCVVTLGKISRKATPGSKSEEIHSSFLLGESIRLHCRRKQALSWSLQTL